MKSTQMDGTTERFGMMSDFPSFFIFQSKTGVPKGLRYNACSRKSTRKQPKCPNRWIISYQAHSKSILKLTAPRSVKLPP